MEHQEIHLPTKEFIEENFERILKEIETLKKKLEKSESPSLVFYRHKDLKTIFGLSDNTISLYRERGILPYTKLGEIYYYPLAEINQILNSNSNRRNIT